MLSISDRKFPDAANRDVPGGRSFFVEHSSFEYSRSSGLAQSEPTAALEFDVAYGVRVFNVSIANSSVTGVAVRRAGDFRLSRASIVGNCAKRDLSQSTMQPGGLAIGNVDALHLNGVNLFDNEGEYGGGVLFESSYAPNNLTSERFYVQFKFI